MRRFPTLVESRFLRFAVPALLYLAQALPLGFIGAAYLFYLKTVVVLEPKTVGILIGSASVPWSLKIVSAPLLDRIAWTRFGRRRPFIILSLFLVATTLLWLILVDPRAHVALVGAILFSINLLVSIQDIATDALAVDVLRDDERGKANGYMWAARSVGLVLGGGGCIFLSKYMGWPGVVVGVGLVILAIAAFVALVRERPAGSEKESATRKRFRFTTLWRSFAFSSALVGLAIAALVTAGYSLVAVVLTQQLPDLVSRETIALLDVVGTVTGVLGALLGGFLADRMGPRRIMAVSAVLLALLLAIWALADPIWAWWPFLFTWSAALSFVFYSLAVATLGLLMGITNPAIGATQFAIFMAAYNLTFASATPLGGWLAQTHGIPFAFWIGAGVQLLVIGALPFCQPEAARERFARLHDRRPAAEAVADRR